MCESWENSEIEMEHVFMVKNTSEKGKSFKPQSVENNIELALNLMKTLVSWPMLECICFSCSYICVSSSAVFDLCALKYLISLLTPEALWRVQSVNHLPDSLIHKRTYTDWFDIVQTYKNDLFTNILFAGPGFVQKTEKMSRHF